MKIAIITANVGGIDKVIEPMDQTMQFDYFCYNEDNLPKPLSSFDDRMKAKYIKLQTHRFLPGYNAYIWLDGRAEVISKEMVHDMIYGIAEADIMCLEHPQRKNIYDELMFIIEKMDEGNEYLLARYDREAILQEYAEYALNDEIFSIPLYACGVFARWNNQKLNDFFDRWWLSVIEFCAFDQTRFSVCAQNEKINIVSIPYENPLVKINKHL